MNNSTGFINCSGDIQLFYQSWRPAVKPQAVLVIVHGFSDHCGRYQNIVDGLIPRGYVIYSYDQRGHGQSPGTRGHINHFSEYREDLHAFLNHVATQEADLPIFLLGQSMGGLIVLDYGLHYPDGLQGVMASAPHLSDPPISRLLTFLSKTLSGVWPSITFDAGIDGSGLSRNPNIVKDYADDPLVHGKGSARLATELSATVANTQANAANFQPPLLIYHGSADIVTDPGGSKRFFDNVKSTNKQYIQYEGGFHEAHNDIHRERVVIDLAHWMEHQMEIASQFSEKQG